MEYSSDEYYESIEQQQIEAESLKEELFESDDDIIETEDSDSTHDDDEE